MLLVLSLASAVALLDLACERLREEVNAVIQKPRIETRNHAQKSAQLGNGPLEFEPPGLILGASALSDLPILFSVSADAFRGNPISSLEGHSIASLEGQNLACVGGPCDFKSQTLDYLASAADLRRVAYCEFARCDPQTVLQTHAYVTAHAGAHRGDRKLVAAGAQYRPTVVHAKQAISRAFHMYHILGVCAYASKDAEYRLNEKRPLH